MVTVEERIAAMEVKLKVVIVLASTHLGVDIISSVSAFLHKFYIVLVSLILHVR